MMALSENVSPSEALENICRMLVNCVLPSRVSGIRSGENWMVISRTSPLRQFPCSQACSSRLPPISVSS